MDVHVLPVSRIAPDLRAQMAEVASRYYLAAAQGVEDELEFGDRVYYALGEGRVRAFLVVSMNHRSASIGGRLHRFAYLGLGCTNGMPMAPVFRRAKADLSTCLEPKAIGVLHLTTRTPFAIRGVEKAFLSEVFPTPSPEGDGDAAQIASYLKLEHYRHAARTADESPFVLRDLKQGRFREAEVERIRAFEGESAIRRFGIDCTGSDEIIVFHRFRA